MITQRALALVLEMAAIQILVLLLAEFCIADRRTWEKRTT